MTMRLDTRTKAINAAMRRAFKSAVRTARLHGTKIWLVRKGKTVGLNPHNISLRGL
jgi:hypothetical protein